MVGMSLRWKAWDFLLAGIIGKGRTNMTGLVVKTARMMIRTAFTITVDVHMSIKPQNILGATM